MKLDPFYLIVDSVDWLRRLLPCGVRLVQLRIKDIDETSLRSQIAEAKKLCAQAGCSSLAFGSPCSRQELPVSIRSFRMRSRQRDWPRVPD